MIKPKLIFFLLCGGISSVFAQNTIATKLSAEQKEQWLQKALSFRQQERYDTAIQYCDSILNADPKDGPIQLLKGDLMLQAGKYKLAGEVYTALDEQDFENTIVKINLSYALFMAHHPAQALKFANLAWKGNSSNQNAIVNYFNAMLWNSQTAAADHFLNNQQSLLSPDQLLVLQARLASSSGDYQSGFKFYKQLIEGTHNKFHVKEYVGVLLAKKDFKTAKEVYLQAGTEFSPEEQKQNMQQLKAYSKPNVGSEYIYFNDIAKNTRSEQVVWWQQGETNALQLGLRFGFSKLNNAASMSLSNAFGNISVNTRVNAAIQGRTSITLQQTNEMSQQSFSTLVISQLIKYQPNDRRMIGLTYTTQTLDFTSELLKKRIRSHDVGYITHVMFDGKNGVYSEGGVSFLADGNRRLLSFGSLYHLFRTQPILKVGLNASFVHFSKQIPLNYFSPNQFYNTEVFLDYGGNLPFVPKATIQFQAAYGQQKIEQQNWQGAIRMNVELGYPYRKYNTTLKYQTSNAASAIGTGYRYQKFSMAVSRKF